MKVLAINSSPNMDKGNTALILSPLLEGMKYAGAEVELFYTKRLDIKPCQGEHNCWFKTPGKCFQSDDMQVLYPKLREADIWVFATPLYWGGITAPMKNLMDRMLPLLNASIELKNGHCYQSLRDEVKKGKVVMVSSCGLWEIDNFYPMLAHMRTFCKCVKRELVGALLRPHASELRRKREISAEVDDIFEAAKNVGQQLVISGEMSAVNYNTISRNLVSLEYFMQNQNREFQRALNRLDEKWY